MRSKALFLDRDGVINQDLGYVNKIENFFFMDGIFSLAQKARARNFLIIVITNQAGIARGMYTEDDFFKLTSWMEDQFLKHEAQITKTYFCPHHPDASILHYKKKCSCRKPGSLLFSQAQKKYNIDMKASVMIGDKVSDLEAANEAGVGSKLLFSQYPPANLGSFLHVDALSNAVKFLC